MIANDSLTWWQIFFAGISTLAIYSFLYRENPLYRIFEHLFIGISTAIAIMPIVASFLWPRVLKPLFGLDLLVFPDGTSPEPYPLSRLLLLIPMCFGMLYYFLLSPRRAWLAQLVIGFSLGVAAGLSFKGIVNEFLPQLFSSFRPLYVEGSWLQTVSNLVFTFTLLSVMSYFFLTVPRQKGGVVDRFASSGRLLMMVCFGAFFGATIMARMALLVERLQFLSDKFFPQLGGLLS